MGPWSQAVEQSLSEESIRQCFIGCKSRSNQLRDARPSGVGHTLSCQVAVIGTGIGGLAGPFRYVLAGVH